MAMHFIILHPDKTMPNKLSALQTLNSGFIQATIIETDTLQEMNIIYNRFTAVMSHISTSITLYIKIKFLI